MKRSTVVVISLLGLGIIGLVGLAVVRMAGGDMPVEVRTVTVQRGDVVETAVATGTIEPRAEVEVKSKVSGVVRNRFVEAGDFVRAGAPLLDIRPDPTPLELAEARRQLEFREMDLETSNRELERQRELRESGIITEQEFERAIRRQAESALQVTTARERLALLQEGRVMIDDQPLESVVLAPIDGFILERLVQVGNPVVPLSTYQAGTVLFRMADMQDLVFRGTVDEIDVGRLAEGMEVLIQIGALPDQSLNGQVSRIALKGRRQDQRTVFPIEVSLKELDETPLRAGLSANAVITIQRADNVLLLPERVISFAGDTASVMVQLEDGTVQQQVIDVGVSDAINIQVLSGLEEGDVVLESGPAAPTPGRISM